MEQSEHKEENRHIPIVIANYSPFRLVLRKSDSWNPTLEQINNNSYDYVKLSRLATFIDIGISPFSLAFGVDGSLVLPATEKFRNRESAVIIFNETLGILLLGGIYCEAVYPTDISYGELFFDGYIKYRGGGTGGIANFHRSIQMRSLGITDAMSLLDPKTILSSEIETAYKKGKSYFSKLQGFSPNLLLNGTSNFVKHQWTEGLVFLWTSIEQIINIIWNSQILKEPSTEKTVIEGRASFLKDFRTWTTSTKIEVLYQNKLIHSELYQLLNIARKSRNDFIHSGKEIEEEKVKSALEALFRLFSLVITDFSNESELNPAFDTILKNQRGDLYPKKRVLEKHEVKYWRSIPPLPGDKTWPKDSEYEIIEELVLKPLEQ